VRDLCRSEVLRDVLIAAAVPDRHHVFTAASTDLHPSLFHRPLRYSA